MANEEAFTLDGLALNDGVTFGVPSVSWPPPRQRQDWIGAADSESQLLVRTPLHENRKVTLRVAVVPQATMDLALAKIATVLDKLQKASRYTDGIGLVWAPATSTLSCTFDVLSGEITDLPIDWESGWLAKSPEFTIELTCKPYWRGTETLTSTASSSTPFVTLDVAGVTGDVPALGRLIVTDAATQSRRHVEWGLEGPLTYGTGSYTAGTSLLIDSDSMVTSGFAGSQVSTSGYDPNASGNNAITLSIVGLRATTALCGTGNLSHVGTFRVKGRVLSSNGSTTLWRLSWRAGDGPMVANEWASTDVAANWAEVDLGSITVPAATVGSQRWTGQIEMYDSSGLTVNTYVDYLILVPTGDGYGKARASYSYTPGAIIGYDAFTITTSGSGLNARVAPAGGTWATSGDATDFAFADAPAGTDETVTRSAVSGTAGRFALLGTAVSTNVEVSVKQYSSALLSGSGWYEGAAVARYVDSSNYLYASFRRTLSGATLIKTLEIRQVVAGVESPLAASSFPDAVSSVNAWWTIKIIAYSTGLVIASLTSDAGQVTATASASSTAAATSGALTSGKSGFFDRFTTSAFGGARYYDDFSVSTPAEEPIVVYSGRNMQIRYDDTLRQDSAGTYSGRPASYRGSRFLVPVGTSRVLVKARRNDVEANADDSVTDATQIQIGWTPRGLAVPR